MEKWIDAEAAVDAVKRSEALVRAFGFHNAIEAIREVPAADVAPVRHAEWIEKEVIDGKIIEQWQSAKCSKCGKYHTTPYMYFFDNYAFCPGCGAKMDGGADDA